MSCADCSRKLQAYRLMVLKLHTRAIRAEATVAELSSQAIQADRSLVECATKDGCTDDDVSALLDSGGSVASTAASEAPRVH